MIPGSVLCEALHPEAVPRKRDCNHQDLSFFKRHFVDYGGKKKGEQEASTLDATFLEDLLQKGDTRAAALYRG